MQRFAKDHQLKARETRQKVLLDARLRNARGWSSVRILNMSSRGMMVHASEAPARGSYVEICRGSQRIVARVAWVDGDRFGARTQDTLVLSAIAKGEPASRPEPAVLANDRRSLHREDAPAERHERSRRWGRRMEFVTVAAIGCAAAFLAFDTMHDVFAKPLRLIESGFSGRAPPLRQSGPPVQAHPLDRRAPNGPHAQRRGLRGPPH